MGSSEGVMRVEREQDVAIRDYPALISDACGAAARASRVLPLRHRCIDNCSPQLALHCLATTDYVAYPNPLDNNSVGFSNSCGQAAGFAVSGQVRVMSIDFPLAELL
jgi:hypothetical protein